MSTICNNRRQAVDAAIIDHAMDLKSTHGSSFAVRYLRNQRIDESTILRVIFGQWSDHRAQDGVHGC